MTIKFDGTWFSDTHGPLIVGSPELQVHTGKYWQVRGEAVVIGQPGGRDIGCRMLIHNGYTRLKDFLSKISRLEKKQGKVGTLEETGNLAREFKDVLFLGFAPVPLDGQEEPGPLLDVGLLTRVDSKGNTFVDNGYFAAYFFHFRQLKVDA
jgi:hypothetical protein